MNLGGVLAQQAAAKRMRPVLVVSPQVQFPAGVDTECVNGSAGTPQVETWLAQDVPDFVTHTFRVKTDRGSWAAIGLSAGGWCAAMVTMLHPAQYSAAIVMGRLLSPRVRPLLLPIPGQRSARHPLRLGRPDQAKPPAGCYLVGDVPRRSCLLRLERCLPQGNPATPGRGRNSAPACRTPSQPVAGPFASQPDLAR